MGTAQQIRGHFQDALAVQNEHLLGKHSHLGTDTTAAHRGPFKRAPSHAQGAPQDVTAPGRLQLPEAGLR